jgi:hypothetical protein
VYVGAPHALSSLRAAFLEFWIYSVNQRSVSGGSLNQSTLKSTDAGKKQEE